MLDDMLDYIDSIRSRPVWQPMDDAARAAFRAALPRQPTPLATVHEDFLKDVLPYIVGNVHPGFVGWVHGGGTIRPSKSNGRSPRGCGSCSDFRTGTSGVFVTGTSLANFVAILIARRAALGAGVHRDGAAHRAAFAH
jgi:hypothetical protein